MHLEGAVVNLENNPMADPLGPTFTEFVRYVLSPYPDDEHWKPFIEHCSLCNVKYDYILK